MDKNKLNILLQKCSSHANEAVEQTEKLVPEFEKILGKVEKLVEKESLEKQRDEDAGSISEEIEDSFRSHLSELDDTIRNIAQEGQAEFRATFKRIQANQEKVSVVFFGRTKAGKSTTIEALIGGDGSSIGDGRQHYTTKVREYPWPDDDSDFSLVDTPGIEGYEGEQLAEKAEEIVETADHIFFLFNGDKESSGELEYFNQLNNMGKGITALLNMREGDVDILLQDPSYVFDEDEIDGHQRRITNYLKENHGISDVEVIPFSAHGAWRAHELNDSRAPKLREISRIQEVEKRLFNFLEDESIGARIRNPRQAFRSYILTLKREVREFAGRFRELTNEANESWTELNDTIGDLKGKAGNRLSEMKSKFKEAQRRISPMVERVVSESEGGSSLNKKLEDILGDTGLREAPDEFRAEVRDLFEKGLEEEMKRFNYDANSSMRRELGREYEEEISKIESAKDRKDTNKWLRVGFKTGSTLGTGAAATYAVSNFWNPSGWVAGAAATVGILASSYAGEQGAEQVAKKWRKADRAKIARQRKKIEKQLKSDVWDYYKGTNDACWDWLCDFTDGLRDELKSDIKPIENSSKHLWYRCTDILEELDELERRLDLGLIRQAANEIVPEISDGKIDVKKVARRPGKHSKVLVTSVSDDIDNPIGFCIGKGGGRTKKLSRWLGESVAWVAEGADIEAQLASGLFPERVKESQIKRVSEDKYRVAVSDEDRKWSVIGYKGCNIQPLEELIDLQEIEVVCR